MKLVFCDTETTSLRPDRRAWDIALIVRDEDGVDHEHQLFIEASELDLGNADLKSLAIGKFHERHPQFNGEKDPWQKSLHTSWSAARDIERLTRGATVVGAVPNFDAEVLDNMLRRIGFCPAWHYHLQDFETLIVGYLRGQGKPVPELPWRSDDLSRLIGVEPPGDEDRHTALGDARWARRVWDAVFGTGSEAAA